MPVEIMSGSWQDGSDVLQNRINTFLEQNKIKLIDIKFTESAAFHPKTHEPDGTWSVLIIYEKLDES